ncbi:hypothetical protein MK079_04615 [Candidatus Gracilibacteria bacterium]|nr:hypothetical protein [Candidatus Gracilibacteria bacterium]
MAKKLFQFDRAHYSYDEIETFCKEKGFIVDRKFKDNDSYDRVIGNSNKVKYFIQTYIYVSDSLHEENKGFFSIDYSKSPEWINYIPLNIEYLTKKDLSKKEEYEEAKENLQKLKKEIDKVYNCLKRKFGQPPKETSKKQPLQKKEIGEPKKKQGFLEAMKNIF